MAIISDSKEPEKTFDYDVFISHASEDTEWCEKLVKRLQKHGLKVWFDRSQLHEPGSNLAAPINEGLAISRRVVLVMTRASFAINQDPSGRRQFIIPILREHITTAPLLRSITYLDFRDEAHFEDNCRRLAEILHGHYPEANFNTLNESKIAEAMPAPGFSYGPKGRAVAKASDAPEIGRRLSSALGSLEQIQEKLNSLVTPEEAQRWLYASLKIFDGRRPIDLIENDEADRVMQILIRLEEGIHN